MVRGKILIPTWPLGCRPTANPAEIHPCLPATGYAPPITPTHRHTPPSPNPDEHPTAGAGAERPACVNPPPTPGARLRIGQPPLAPPHHPPHFNKRADNLLDRPPAVPRRRTPPSSTAATPRPQPQVPDHHCVPSSVAPAHR